MRLLDKLPPSAVSIRRPPSVLIAAIILGVEGLYFEQLGTLISVIGFAFALMLACGERRPLHLIAVPIVLAGFIYGIFVIALSVNLP